MRDVLNTSSSLRAVLAAGAIAAGSLAGPSASPARAQQPEPIAVIWAAATQQCTTLGLNRREACTDLGRRTDQLAQTIADAAGDAALALDPAAEESVAPLTDDAFRTRTPPADIIRARMDALRSDAQREAEGLAEDAARLAALESALAERVDPLSRLVQRNMELLAAINQAAPSAPGESMSSLETLPRRVLTDDTLMAALKTIDDLLSGALAATQVKDNASDAFRTLRTAVGVSLTQLERSLATVPWERRHFTLDARLILGLRRIAVIFQLLYADDLERFYFQDADFERDVLLGLVNQFNRVLADFEEQAEWSVHGRALRSAHGAYAEALDVVLAAHRSRPLRGEIDVSEDGDRERRSAAPCLTDEARNFTSTIRARMRAESGGGLYTVDFNPEASEAELDFSYNRRCFNIEALPDLEIGFPAQLAEATLGMNLYMALQIAQLNWQAAQAQQVRDLSRLFGRLGIRMTRMRDWVSDEPLVIAQRGTRISCGLTSVDFTETGTVRFDVQVNPDGSVNAVTFRSELPDGFSALRFERQIQRLMECQTYRPRTINGAPVEFWKTIELEIQ